MYPALERHGLGARLLEAAFFRIDGDVSRAAVGTASPVRAPDSVAMLFSERLSALGSDWDAGFGFDMVRLSVLEAEPLAADADRSCRRGGEGGRTSTAWSTGSARGSALRASPASCRSTRIFPSAPSCAAAACRISARGARAWSGRRQSEAETPPDRPLRLFARPEPVEVMAEVPEGPPLRFRWRRVVHEVARAEGPERIAPEWWRPEDDGRATRDYFRVEDAEGRRYWLFREGLYGRETASPVWYVHGLVRVI